MTIDFDEFRKDMKNAVEELSHKHNINMVIKNISYSANGFHFKTEARVKGTGLKIAEDYDFHRSHKNLPERGSRIVVAGKKYDIIGWKNSARKNKIVIENMVGKIYVISLAQLRYAEVVK